VIISALLFAHQSVGDKLFPTDLSTYTGTGWNGIVYDFSTDADIKKIATVTKGAIRPEGLHLATENQRLADVHVLLDGRGAKAHAIGFQIAYGPTTLDEKQLNHDLTEEGVPFYSKDRYENWRYLYYSKRGALAQVSRDGTVHRLLLSNPKLIKLALRGLDDQPTEVRDLREYTSRERTIDIGDVKVGFSFTRFSLRSQTAAQSEIEDEVAHWRYPRQILMTRGGSGTMRVNIDVNFDRKKTTTNVSVSSSIAGDTYLGHVTGYGSSSKTYVEHEPGDPRWPSYRPMWRLIETAVDDSIRSTIKAMRDQKVPTAQDFADREWMATMNEVIR